MSSLATKGTVVRFILVYFKPHFTKCAGQHHISKMGYFKCTILFNICTISFLSEESVPKQSGSIALHKSFSQGKYCTQFCLFVLANQIQACKLRFLSTFGTCYSSQMPFSRLKCGKHLRNMSQNRFVSTPLHKSLLQAKYVEYCM